jgi:hypothetical protein
MIASFFKRPSLLLDNYFVHTFPQIIRAQVIYNVISHHVLLIIEFSIVLERFYDEEEAKHLVSNLERIDLLQKRLAEMSLLTVLYP